MFTGIIQGKYPIIEIHERPGLRTFVVAFPTGNIDGLKLGASVAVNGACLTVAGIDGERVSFDVMAESLAKTNLGAVQQGDEVNIERSARFGDEIGGHVMSGHVIDTAEIVRIERPENNVVMTFRVAPERMKYIFDKGFIGLDGASLTIVNPDKSASTFDVWLIPETLRLTCYANRRVGDFVNLEIDSRTQVIVDTVEAIARGNERN